MSASQQSYNNRSVLSSSEASTRYGISRSHILYLVRTGKIEGTKPGGHDWMIYEDSLQAFLSQPRSPGRKGPRKKRIEKGNRVLLSTAEASAISGYVKDTLLRLLRSSRIEGERSGRTWLIYEDSLLAYRQSKHPTREESVETAVVPKSE